LGRADFQEPRAVLEAKRPDPQIAFILRQVEEGTPVEEVCRKAGISAQPDCRWRASTAAWRHQE